MEVNSSNPWGVNSTDWEARKGEKLFNVSSSDPMLYGIVIEYSIILK